MNDVDKLMTEIHGNSYKEGPLDETKIETKLLRGIIETMLAGKVIVPVEPTKEMIAASDGIIWTDDTDQNSRNQYKAMLSVGSGVDVAGMVSVPMEQLQDICFAIHNPDFVKAMSGGDILRASLKVVEDAMLSTIGEQDEH